MSRRDNKVLIKCLSLEFPQGWLCLEESRQRMTAFVMKGIMEVKSSLLDVLLESSVKILAQKNSTVWNFFL